MIRRTILTTTMIGALASAGLAGAAEAPVVSKQQFIAGEAPVTVPGTGVKKGEWMGGRAVLVYRDVTLEGDQEVRLTLWARKGQRIRGLAVDERTKVGFKTLTDDYAGKKKVVVQAFLHRGARGGEATNRIYALSR